jgi:hypothetical protein
MLSTIKGRNGEAVEFRNSRLAVKDYARLRREVIRLLYTESDVSSSLTPGTKHFIKGVTL